MCGKGRQGSDIVGKKRQHPGAVQRVLSHAKQSGDRLRIQAVHDLARLVPFIPSVVIRCDAGYYSSAIGLIIYPSISTSAHAVDQ